jgi:hypothetical protein
METRKRVLGAEHPDTLTSMANLARTLKEQSRDGEAFEMMTLAVQLQRKVLGANHPSTLRISSELQDW